MQQQMLCENDKRSKDSQNTLQSRRQRYIVKIREQQLQKIFKSLRQSSLKPQIQQVSPPPIHLPVQQIQTQYTPENIQLLQNYLIKLIPPQIPLNQQIITSPINKQIQQINHRQINPPKQYEIYFEKQNIRVYKKLLGQGSFSRVWLGMDLIKNQWIAAKQVKKLEQSQQKCLKQFNSTYIIKVLQIIRHNHSTFIILQFCTKNLREELLDCNYDLIKSLYYFQQIVKGMNQLQKKNIIHRDLKFQNILLNHNVIKIADFGLAKFLGDEIEIQSRRCGSPYTMAPEIYFSHSHYPSYTSKCDIWSLGIILHEMLYKQHPFGKSKQNFKKELRVKLKRCFGVLDYLIDRCLMKNPKKRADWGQFLYIFDKYLINKDRYLSAKFLPIQCESIIYDQRNLLEDNYRINKLQKRQKELEIVIEVQIKKPRIKQSQQKMMNDYNVNSFVQQRKVEKLKVKNKIDIQSNKKPKITKQDFKQQFKNQGKKLALVQVNKAQKELNKGKDNLQNPLLKIQQELKQHRFEVKIQNFQQEKTCKISSKPKDQDSNLSRMCIQIAFLGIFTAIIISMCLFG